MKWRKVQEASCASLRRQMWAPAGKDYPTIFLCVYGADRAAGGDREVKVAVMKKANHYSNWADCGCPVGLLPELVGLLSCFIKRGRS